MDIDISQRNEDFLNEQVNLGAYHDRNQAMDAAVDLLRRRYSILTAIDEGKSQIDAGDFQPLVNG